MSIEETISHYYDQLGWCTCGQPWKAVKEIAKFLEGRKAYNDFPDDDLSLCLAYELDRAGFTDHGSSIFGCWLTEDGEKFLWAIKEAEKLGILEYVL